MYVILYVLGFYASYIIPINEVKYRCYYQDRFSISADREQLVGVLPLWVLGVGLLYGEDTRSVDFIYLHAPRAMDDTLLVYQNAHVGDGSMRSVVCVGFVFSVVFVVCVVGLWFAEESQIAGLGVL